MSWIEQPAENIVGSFNLTLLQIDEAFLNFTSISNPTSLWLYSLSSACYSCPYTRVSEEPFNESNVGRKLKLSTYFPTKYRFRTEGTQEFAPIENDGYAFCSFGEKPTFQEFGVYGVSVGGDKENPNCDVTVAADPVNIYYPLILAVIAYAVIILLVFLFGKFRKHRASRRAPSTGSADRLVSQTPPPTSAGAGSTKSRVQSASSSGNVSSPLHSSSSNNPGQPATPPRQRLRSLDAFRGICIVVMIFVNYGGGRYYFFEHAPWDGLTVADLVFPWFLWIMGVCVPIAVKSQVKRGTPRFKIFKAILIRSIKLIALGILYNTVKGRAQFGEDANLRIPGVLQRFGLCYFVCATLVLISMTVNFAKPGGKGGKIKAAIQDITIIWTSWIPAILILLTHFLLTFFLSVPGCPKGYLGPGGLDLINNTESAGQKCIGGAAGYIDTEVLTVKHIYNWATAKEIFHSTEYDPEGILGTLTSIFQVWLGVQTGATLVVYPRPMSRLKRWGIWAILTGAIGTALCGGKMTGGWIPVNKNLWSLSYVLVTSCFANILLSALYFLIDIKKWWSGSPFYEPGMNSILLYMGHSILDNALPFHWSVGPMRTHAIRLAESLWATTLWTLTGVWLHWKKTYWSI